jgi:hypothetical protein
LSFIPTIYIVTFFCISDPFSPFLLCSAVRINEEATRRISLKDGDNGEIERVKSREGCLAHRGKGRILSSTGGKGALFHPRTEPTSMQKSAVTNR